jgi:hypothetical protein
MPRMQVYLPDELYQLIVEADRYIEELADEVGEPSVETTERADRLAAEIQGRRRGRKAG